MMRGWFPKNLKTILRHSKELDYTYFHMYLYTSIYSYCMYLILKSEFSDYSVLMVQIYISYILLYNVKYIKDFEMVEGMSVK